MCYHRQLIHVGIYTGTQDKGAAPLITCGSPARARMKMSSVSATLATRWIPAVLLSIFVVAGERDVVRRGEGPVISVVVPAVTYVFVQGCTN